MALDKAGPGDDSRHDAPADTKTSNGYRWTSPDEIDAMTDEEYAAWEAAYMAEIKRRGDEVEAGLAKTYTLEEVMASVDALINAR